MFYSDNPIKDWDDYCDYQERQFAKFPICQECGAVMTDMVYDIHGELLCEDCVNELFRTDAEKYVQEGYI